MNSFLVIKKESVEKQREVAKQQDIGTSLMFHLQERDEQIEELMQILKSSMCM